MTWLAAVLARWRPPPPPRRVVTEPRHYVHLVTPPYDWRHEPDR